MSLKFAANLSMMFTEVAFEDRFAAAADSGFRGVEFLFPYEWPAEAIAGWLADNQLQQVLFNLSPGDWASEERGIASLPGRETEFAESVEQAISYAHVLKCPRLHAMAGLKDDAFSDAQHHATYVDNIAMAAKRCEEEGLSLLIEPINSQDIPGYFLNDFDQAMDIIEELQEEFPALKLQFDIYHCAKIHGDIARRIIKAEQLTAHYQIAGIPNRHEPSPDTLPLTEIYEVISARHPDLWIGCEYRPAGATKDGLSWLPVQG